MNLDSIWLIFGLLNVMGFCFNLLVEQLDRRGWMKAFTSLMVVGGVAGTLLAMVPVVGWQVTAVFFGAFASSGFWMVVGSLHRFVQQQNRELEEIREMLGDAHTTRMAE